MRAAGGIVIGKSNVPEFGAGANSRNAVYGATGNPFDPSKSAAGSSGGSGVALACGMVPIATGSDTGGSLRNPAAFNGIVGFRPTPGLVASEKSQFGFSPLSVLGPMARTVPDVCLLLSAMVSDDKRDPLATTIHGRQVRRPEDFAAPAEIDLSALRVALTPDFGCAPTELTAQAMTGTTRMGYRMAGKLWVDTRFRSAFLLATRTMPWGSVSARAEAFGARGRGSVLGATTSEDGWAGTLAARRPIGGMSVCWWRRSTSRAGATSGFGLAKRRVSRRR